MEKRWNSETVPLVRTKDNKRLNRRQITLLLLVLTGIMLILVLGIAGFTCLILLNPVQSSTDPYTKNYQHAAIATDAAPCSSIGADLLMKGGTAVDSAVGSMLCVGICTPLDWVEVDLCCIIMLQLKRCLHWIFVRKHQVIFQKALWQNTSMILYQLLLVRKCLFNAPAIIKLPCYKFFLV